MGLYTKTIKNEEVKMTKILLGLTVMATMHLSLYADVSMHSSEIPEHPIVRPPLDPDRPLRPNPIVRPALLYGEHYHTYVSKTECDCTEYIEIIKEKDAEIEALLNENARLKEEAQEDLQKRLKEEYDKELKKFEERAVR